jgi:hypothetical protein
MAISEECDDQMARKMFVVFGDKFPAELANELIDGLMKEQPTITDKQYKAAVTAWCATKRWAPKPVDILDLIQAQSTATRTAKTKSFEKKQEEHERLTLPTQSETRRTVEIFGRPVTYTVESRQVNCRDCSDTGKAHFYYGKAERRVWFVWQWDDMTLEQQDESVHQTAICDCPAGLAHPHREWRSEIWHRGQLRNVPVYGLMELVKKRKARWDSARPPLHVYTREATA